MRNKYDRFHCILTRCILSKLVYFEFNAYAHLYGCYLLHKQWIGCGFTCIEINRHLNALIKILFFVLIKKCFHEPAAYEWICFMPVKVRSVTHWPATPFH